MKVGFVKLLLSEKNYAIQTKSLMMLRLLTKNTFFKG